MSVTVVIGKRHAFAGLLLFGLAALLGTALIAPPASEATTVTYTRSASCAGLDFYPTDSRTEYDNIGPLRVWRLGDSTNDDYGSGVFRCDPGLPTGAVVKQVQFTAEEKPGVNPPSGFGVGKCSLVRSGLTAATARTAEALGSVVFGATNGTVRLTTTSISYATIDNANWGYWLECSFNSASSWDATNLPGLYGADVIYAITAAKG
jgi:hypothetical protein